MSSRRAALCAMALAAVLAACGTSSGSDATDKTTTTIGSASTKPQTLGKGAVSCSTVDPLSWKVRASVGTADKPISALMLKGTIPRPPGASPSVTTPTSVSSYGTPSGYLKEHKSDDPGALTKMMEAAGFVQGTVTGFDDPNSSFTVQSMTFRDTPAAATFLRQQLPSLCTEAGGKVLRANQDSGIVYLDKSGAPHAQLIIGHDLFTLSLCDCAKGDRAAETKAWAATWLNGFGTGKAKPASWS